MLSSRIARLLAPTLLVVLLWYLTALVIEGWRGVPFPTPLESVQRLGQLLLGLPLNQHSIYRHIAVSLQRWLGAFSLAALLGLLFGLAAARWEGFRLLTAPIPQLLLLVPGLAWIPVALLIFGVGEAATGFMIALTAFAPIALATRDGIRQIDPAYLRAGRMLGATERALFRQVALPAALPALLAGMRIGLGNSWRVLVAAEMVVGSGSGLGFSILESRWNLDYPAAMACILCLCLLGLLFERGLFGSLERVTLRLWRGAPEA
ncbi:MAG: ABC transporter permease subunit [Desulfuromonas thiophila]|nr:ABC transporter permease subunit [Desulfuromonas thiophila]